MFYCMKMFAVFSFFLLLFTSYFTIGIARAADSNFIGTYAYTHKCNPESVVEGYQNEESYDISIQPLGLKDTNPLLLFVHIENFTCPTAHILEFQGIAAQQNNGTLLVYPIPSPNQNEDLYAQCRLSIVKKETSIKVYEISDHACRDLAMGGRGTSLNSPQGLKKID